MRKRTSKRRWKAKFRLGKYIPLEAVYNHRLEKLVSGGEWHTHAQMVRRAI